MDWLARTTLTAATCRNSQEVNLSTDSGYVAQFTLAPGEARETLIPLQIPARSSMDLVATTPSPGCREVDQSSNVRVQLSDLVFTEVEQPGVGIADVVGFHSQETAPSGEAWRWIDGSSGELRLVSTSNRPTVVMLAGDIQSPLCQASQQVYISVDGQPIQSVAALVDSTTPIALQLEFSPFAEKLVKFSSSSQGCMVPGDDRVLGPKLQDLRLVSSTQE